MAHIARNLTDAVDDCFAVKSIRFTSPPRDPPYTKEFCRIIAESGVESIHLPPQSPNLNAYAERFVRTIKENCCLRQMILFGEDALRNAIREFVEHYHHERNHQGLDNRLLIGNDTIRGRGSVRKRQRVGGLLNHYYREAA
jgi:putative transposase